MNYKKLILLTIPFLWISCGNVNENRNTTDKDLAIVQTKIDDAIKDSNVYDDIDMFKIEGIGKIQHPTSYPYIKIENKSDSKRAVIYKYSATDSSERVYEKKNNYWFGYYEFWGDSGFIRNYEYIQANKIILQVYYGTPMKTGFHLDDITVIENNKSTMYCYWGKIGPYLEPDINNLKLIKDKINVIITEETKRKNGVMIIYSKSLDKIKNQIFDSDTTCYNAGEHSRFWIEKFGYNNKVECR